MTSSFPDSIAVLLDAQGVRLSAQQRDLLAGYVALLERWNRRINLVGTQSSDALWRRHLADCLMLQRVPRPPQPRTWVDIGSGAGLPAVPLAILYPADRVIAVETVAKKATFLQEVVRSLPLPNLLPLRQDVHTLAGDPAFAGCDAVVARAFTALPELLTLGLALLPPGGELWAMKGRRWESEATGLPTAVRAGYDADPQVYPYRLAPGEEGCIVVYRRHAASPNPV